MRPRIGYLTVFVTGACVMVVELTASRLLAPSFGSSLYVWTNVIGVILVALSVGYWLGGRVAEATKEPRILFATILAAGLSSALVPYAVGPFSQVTTDSLLGAEASGATVIFLGSFLVLLALFALPVFLLGTVSPFVIRLLTISDARVGEVAGKVFAVGTAGSILGTFLPALFLVPAIGSRRTILLAASALALLGLAGLVARPRRTVGTSALAAAVLVTLTPASLRERPGLIEQRESAYQYISVQDEPQGRTMRFNEGLGMQSLLVPRGMRTGYYWDYIPSLVGALDQEGTDAKQALVVGVAGGIIPRLFAETWGEHVRTTGVEIDPAVADMARRHFGLDEIPNFLLKVEDGRVALREYRLLKERYDLVFLDAYTNQLYIPPHLATVEFFREIRGKLAPGGILAANAAVFSERSPLFRRLLRSFQEAFPVVYTAPMPNSGNILIVAAEREIDWDGMPDAVPEQDRDLALTLAASMRLPETETAPPLTDDDAPVELLTDAQVFELLRASRVPAS